MLPDRLLPPTEMSAFARCLARTPGFLFVMAFPLGFTVSRHWVTPRPLVLVAGNVGFVFSAMGKDIA